LTRIHWSPWSVFGDRHPPFKWSPYPVLCIIITIVWLC